MNDPTSLKRGVLFLSLEKAVNGGITILLMPFIISHIGIDGFGLWGFLLAVTAYLQCLDLGVSLSIERFVAYYHAQNAQKALSTFLSTGFTALTILTLGLFPPVFFLGEWVIAKIAAGSTHASLDGILTALYPAIALNWITFVFMGIPRGLQRFDISSKIQITGKLTFAALLLILLPQHKSIFSLIIAFDVQALVIFILYIRQSIILRKDLSIFKFSISFPMLKQMISYGFKIQVSAFSCLANQQFDKILLATFCNLSLAGLYEATSKLVFAVKDILNFLSSVLMPKVSSLSAQSNLPAIQSLLVSITSQLSILGFFFTGLMVINGEWILKLLLDSNESDFALSVFYVLSITGLWQSMAAGAVAINRGTGKTGIEMTTTILVLVINIIASSLFLKFTSANYIVFGTGISMLAAPLISYYITCKHLPFPFFRFLRNALMVPVISFTISTTISLLVTRNLPIPSQHPLIFIIPSILFILFMHLSLTLLHNESYRVFSKSIVYLLKRKQR